MARIATATATRSSAKSAEIPTLVRLTDGRAVLTGIPFMIDNGDGGRMQSRRVLGGAGFGLQFRNFEHVTGWVAESRKAGRAAAKALEAHDIAVIDLSGKGAAAIEPGAEVVREPRTPRTRRAADTVASPVTVRQGAPKAPRAKVATGETIMSNAEASAYGMRNDLSATITAALVPMGVGADVIAAAIAAAVRKADEIAKAATATVSAPAKAPKGASVKAPKAGERVITVADGVPLAAAATAARKAINAAGMKGVSVSKVGRTLVAYRPDGGAVPATVDAVMVAGVASLA